MDSQQSLCERRQLLQQKIFSHPSISNFNVYSRAAFDKLSKCHTSGIGVHQYKCNNAACAIVHQQYHSCGNRHCPNCGGMRREQWIQERMNELLPTTYFHVVFTLPQELRSLAMGNMREMYSLLFEAAHYAINKLSADKKWMGAKPGIISVLHTWGQDVGYHPHVHCIVTGGGISQEQMWVKEKRGNGKFLFPKTSITKIYKAYFVKQMQKRIAENKIKIEDVPAHEAAINTADKKIWNVYAKAPFAGPAQVIEYIGRYTHKVAITAHRIQHIGDSDITFTYKDYNDGDKIKQMTLSHTEFTRRFEKHILPKRFVRIRHAGFLCHRNKTERLQRIHTQLLLPPPPPRVTVPLHIQVMQRTGNDITICPVCKKGKLELMGSYKYINGKMINVNDLRNRGSPLKQNTNR